MTFAAIDPFLLVSLLVITALIAGMLAGLLGVGGGIVIVPVLFWIFDALGVGGPMAMTVSVATSLACIIPISFTSARSHRKRGNLDGELFRKWAPWIFLGALAGGLLSFVLDGSQLRFIFGAVALLVAINMALPKPLNLGARLPTSKIVQGAMAWVIGVFSALMGIGGGTLTVPTLSMFSFPTHRAVGTAAAFGLVIALPAVCGFIASGWTAPDLPPFQFGYVNWAAAAILAPISMAVTPWGAALASRLPARQLRLAFALFLAITSVRMLWGVLD